MGAVSAVLTDDYSESLSPGMTRIVGCLIVVGTFGAEGAAKYGPIVAGIAREMSDHRGSVT